MSFLELFFDLVFVVVISQLAHRLAEHPSWSGVGWFVLLFYAVWASWLNGTYYHDLPRDRRRELPSVHVRADALRHGDGGLHRGRSRQGIGGIRARVLGEHPHPGRTVVPYRRARPRSPAGVVPYSAGYLVAAPACSRRAPASTSRLDTGCGPGPGSLRSVGQLVGFNPDAAHDTGGRRSSPPHRR